MSHTALARRTFIGDRSRRLRDRRRRPPRLRNVPHDFPRQFSRALSADAVNPDAVVCGMLLAPVPNSGASWGRDWGVAVAEVLGGSFPESTLPGVRLAGECLSKGGTQDRPSRGASRSAKRLSWEDLLPRPHGAPCSQKMQTDLPRCRVRVGFGWVLSCRRARADGPWRAVRILAGWGG